MSKTFFKMSLAVLAAVGLASQAGAVVTGTTTLSGHVPKVVSVLTSTGRLAGTNQLHLAIGLPLRNQDGLKALLAQSHDPASPNYHHFLSADEFTAQFGPTESDYQAVVNYAQANGFAISARHSNRMLVEVDAAATNVERAFNVSFRTYNHPTEGRQFFAPDKEPSVPANLSVLDIGGLNNYSRPHTRIKTPTAKVTAATVKNGSGPFGSYRGNDFRAAYAAGTTLTGAGQKVALVQFDGYLASDIALYESRAGLPTVALTNILLQGFSGFPVYTSFQDEVTLDIEMAVAMAPGLSQVMVYEGDPNQFNPVIVLNRIATDNAARQISCSWGWTGGPNGTIDQIFIQMILQGQTFFDASGDVDAFLPPGASGSAPGSVDDPNSFNAPSDNPYITQVGGTTLSTAGPGGARTSEKVWNWGLLDPVNLDGIGSSGGISGYYPIPTWQQGMNMATNLGSTTFRSLPDVAMTGDNVDVVVNGVEQNFGGTSCASPLWAGFMALVNQQASLNGRSAIGFLNPALYTLGKSASYTNYFYDITIGNNTWSQSPANFPAVPGYDLATGWGTPQGTNLINALAATGVLTNGGGGNANVIISAPIAPWGSTLSAINGSNPNGDWFLFIQDDKALDVGMINNGWSVTLTTANPVGYAADSQIYASATNIFVAPGTNFSLTLCVTNYGPSIATNVYVTDTLPGTGVSLTSSNTTLGTVSRVGATLTWTLGNLAVNAGGKLTLNFAAVTAGTYLNYPSVGSTTYDPNQDDDVVATAITVGVVSPPVFTVTNNVLGQFTFNLSGAPGTSVIIQASTNLFNWVPIYTNVSPFSFTDSNSTNYPYRFYRAVTGP